MGLWINDSNKSTADIQTALLSAEWVFNQRNVPAKQAHKASLAKADDQPHDEWDAKTWEEAERAALAMLDGPESSIMIFEE